MATATFPRAHSVADEAPVAREALIGPRLRAILFSIGMLAGMAAFAVGLSQFYGLGQAEAENASVIEVDAGAGSAVTMTTTTETTVTTGPVAPEVVEVAAEPAGDSGSINRLWRNGTLVGAGGLTVFIILAFALKLDKRRAFYYSAGMTAVGLTLDAIVRGDTPTVGMLISTITAFVGVLVRGPDGVPKSAPPELPES